MGNRCQSTISTNIRNNYALTPIILKQLGISVGINVGLLLPILLMIFASLMIPVQAIHHGILLRRYRQILYWEEIKHKKTDRIDYYFHVIVYFAVGIGELIFILRNIPL